NVSNMGMPKIIRGTIKEINCSLGIFKSKAIFQRLNIFNLRLKTAKRKPIKVDPPSPKKIEAGLKLYLRNPNDAPDKAKAIKAKFGWLLFKTRTKKNKDAKKPTPETSPSIPSSIFIELVIKVIKQAVSVQFTMSNLNKLKEMPLRNMKRNAAAR
ncbi:MAG: hypothetical protein ABIC39_06135, partial [Pseudomonadota bacterium]